MSLKTAERPIQHIGAKKNVPFAKPITWEYFKNRYLSREDNFTYEWVNGYVEKTKRTIDYKQILILRNLMNLFSSLLIAGKVNGLLASEIDTFFVENHRRPDICYLTDQQMYEAAADIPPVPKFVIEVISNNDKMKRVQEKMVNYWDAEVEVIWHIFPDLKHVHIYHGKKMTVLMNDELCSAAPILPDFIISVNDIFA